MPIKKAATIGALAFAGTLALTVVTVGDEPEAAPPTAVPLPQRPQAKPAKAASEQPEEAKPASTTPTVAEPEALFQPAAAAATPRPASPRPTPVPVRGAGGDRDCPDFGSQAEAQRFFLENGGPDDDPHRLDRDKDGIACENN